MEEKNQDKSALFIRLFEEGKQFTEDLLKENERLRRLVAKLKAGSEKSTQGPGDRVMADKIQSLESENRQFREELDQLKVAYEEAEQENQEFAQKYVEVEQQNQGILNLYVASQRLHSTLEFKEVINNIKEIVINLIGSEMFGIFVKDEKSNELTLLDQEGLEGVKIHPIPVEFEPVDAAVKSGEPFFPQSTGNKNDPIAYIPLRMEGQLLGMILIYELLQQKDGFSSLDRELFSLIADHAATAIYCAQLHSQSERKLSTMQNLLELLKMEK
jgi:nitrate/nitrite-specific signal transduction histidine kinase